MRLHTIADYWTQRIDRIEGYEYNIAHAYLDPTGIPTIGIGLNLQTHRWLILETLGFDVRARSSAETRARRNRTISSRFLVVINQAARTRRFDPGSQASISFQR